MADITMCGNESCPIKMNCYRYTATPNEYQSYFMGMPLLKEDQQGCVEFWDNKERK